MYLEVNTSWKIKNKHCHLRHCCGFFESNSSVNDVNLYVLTPYIFISGNMNKYNH